MDLQMMVQKYAEAVARRSKPQASEVLVIAYTPLSGGRIAVGARVTDPANVRALLTRLLKDLPPPPAPPVAEDVAP